MMKAFSLLFIYLFSLSGFAAEIGREGGGGGGIKINGRVYTFAEAGLRLQDPEIPYFPDEETIQATLETTEKLDKIFPPGFQKIFSDPIFQNDHIYQKVEVVNQPLFDRLKEEYAKYLDTLPIEGDFVLPAYTEEKTTYLFPDFFAAAPATRALYMIHEAAFFLKPHAKLEDVLRLEIAVVHFLREPGLLQNKLAVYDALRGLHILRHDELGDVVHTLYLKALLDSGIDLRLSDFVAEGTVVGSNCGRKELEIPFPGFPTDAITLSHRRHLEPSFFRRFYQLSLLVDAVDDRLSPPDAYGRRYWAAFDLGCGVMNKNPENFRLSVPEGRFAVYATAIDQSPAPPSDSIVKVVEARVSFYLPGHNAGEVYGNGKLK